jgi:hypothetical protein
LPDARHEEEPGGRGACRRQDPRSVRPAGVQEPTR